MNSQLTKLKEIIQGDVREIAQSAIKLGYKCNYDPPSDGNKIIFHRRDLGGAVFNYKNGNLLCWPTATPTEVKTPATEEGEYYPLRDGCIVNFYYQDEWIAAHRTSQDLSKYEKNGHNVGKLYLSKVDTTKFDANYSYTFHITCKEFHNTSNETSFFMDKIDKQGNSHKDTNFISEAPEKTPNLKWGYCTRGENPTIYLGPYMHAMKVLEKNKLTEQKAELLQLPYDKYIMLYAIVKGGNILEYYKEYYWSVLAQKLQEKYHLVFSELVSGIYKSKTTRWFASRMLYKLNPDEIYTHLLVNIAGWVPVLLQLADNRD